MHTIEPNPLASFEDRRLLGRSRRRVVARTQHGKWSPPNDRPDPVEQILISDRGRVRRLLPLKYGRMIASPFAFFRGSVGVMAWDLAHTPDTRIFVQLCGDAHVRNLGAFSGPDGRLVFDINDFDESMRGPWEWDLKRFAASVILAGREAKEAEDVCAAAVKVFCQAYREQLMRFAEMPAFESFRYRVGRLKSARPVDAILRKAERATPQYNVERLTTAGRAGPRRFARRPPLLVPCIGGSRKDVLTSLVAYRETLASERRLVLDAYRPSDVAMKVVGIGSVGTRDYVVLFFGRNENDPLFLQVKEEPRSCYHSYLPRTDTPSHQGQRVAEAQRRIQTNPDLFVGWTKIAGRDFLVRQLADHKAAAGQRSFRGEALGAYARVCGEVFAKAHARTGDVAILTGYCGRGAHLDDAISRFARAYADQVEKDYESFMRAARLRSFRVLRGT